MKNKAFCKITVLFLSLLICLSSVLCFASCSKKPELDGLYDRFVYLIKESEELNTLFFGAGLPVYKKESTLANIRGIYFGYTKSTYDVVMDNSKYSSIADLKAKAERVYSTNYLDAIYETAFEGVLYDGGSYLRFYSEGDSFYQNEGINIYELEKRIYDYSTMKIIRPSNQDRVNVEIESFLVSAPEIRRTINLAFQNENGQWYLDSPTY